MPALTDFPARGKVIGKNDGIVIFNPAGTNYEIRLSAPSYAGPVSSPVSGLIRVRARKVYTVPSGGNFISPIFGPPKILQGRVKYLDERTMVIQAGVPVAVELPTVETSIDLVEGGIAVGVLVNVVAQPGGTFELLRNAVVR